jgi:4-hydroxybenzoate polyprenyltransferase
MLLVGGALGLTITHWAPLAVLLIPLGVAAYAARPRGRRPRPKDIIGVKNAYVAGGIVGFAVLSVLAVAAPVDSLEGWLGAGRTHVVPIAVAGVLLGVRVALDAALCDIDDESADREYGTATLATTFGVRGAWLSTGWARLMLIVAMPLASPCPWRPRMVWAGVTVLGMLSLRLARPAHVRDWVDLRFPAEAVLAGMLVWAWEAMVPGVR